MKKQKMKDFMKFQQLVNKCVSSMCTKLMFCFKTNCLCLRIIGDNLDLKRTNKISCKPCSVS